MERLTKLIDGKAAYRECNGPCGTCDGAMCFDIEPMVDRLAAYEDTGMEPDEVLTGKELAEVACAMNLLKEYQSLGTIARLKELAQAEKDGRLVAHMPGETVYDRFGAQWVIKSSEIHLIQGQLKQLFRCWHPGTEDYYAMYEDEILTREEAEAAMKKREEAT